MATINQIFEGEQLELLRGLLKPGDTLYFILRHRSESGMSRWVDVYKFDGQEIPLHLGKCVAWALGYHWDMERGGFKVAGIGFDVATEVVGALGRKLFGDVKALRRVWL